MVRPLADVGVPGGGQEGKRCGGVSTHGHARSFQVRTGVLDRDGARGSSAAERHEPDQHQGEQEHQDCTGDAAAEPAQCLPSGLVEVVRPGL
jgi:hypothetical protein